MSTREHALNLVDQVPKPPNYVMPPGATAFQLRSFEERSGLVLPIALADWLTICNGALVGPGGVYGLAPKEPWLDLEEILSAHPKWQRSGWIPIAGDGTGNYYVVSSRAEVCRVGTVAFIDSGCDLDKPIFAVASDVWLFLIGMLSREIGETWWPFDADGVEKRDPTLLKVRELRLPWDD